MEGVRDGIPIGLGYFAVAFSLGIAARSAGLTPFQGFLTSILNNASAGQYAGFSMMASDGSYFEMALITLVTNARYLLMSCALSQRFAPGTPAVHRLLIGFDVTDELFGITIARPGLLNPYYTYGAIVAAAPCWATGTALGITGRQPASAAAGQRPGRGPLRHVPGSHHSAGEKGQDHRPAHHRQLCGQLRRFRSASDRGAVLGHADHHLDRSPVGRRRFDRAGGTS